MHCIQKHFLLQNCKTDNYFSPPQSKKQDRRDIKKIKCHREQKTALSVHPAKPLCAYVWRLCACSRGCEEAACRKQQTCVANPSPDSSSSTPLMFHSFPPHSSSSLSNLVVPGLTRPYPAGARP